MITVLKVDIVESRFVFWVERLEPVIVEKVERAVWIFREFREMTVLKDDIVESRFVF